MRITVAVTGATGVEMSYYLMRALKSVENCELHLIISHGARVTWGLESDIPIEKLEALADFIHDEHNMAASVSSGSFVTEGMIVMPCSMKTLAGIYGRLRRKSGSAGGGCVPERGTETCACPQRNASGQGTH